MICKEYLKKIIKSVELCAVSQIIIVLADVPPTGAVMDIDSVRLFTAPASQGLNH